jgi:transposase
MSMHFAGLDWASQEHVVCVVDEQGSVQKRFTVRHNEEGLGSLRERLAEFGDLSIAIERPSGVVVDTLLGAGLRVVAVHPNIIKAGRSRYHTAGKSDAGDAYIFADMLRTDGHRFAPLVPHSEEIKSLRMLVRLRKDLVRTRVGLANQLRSLLDDVFPGAACIFSAVDCPISLAFLRAFPSESRAAKLNEKRLARFLSEHAYTGRRTAVELLARLHGAAQATVSDGLSQTAAQSVLAVVSVLEPIVDQIAGSGRVTAAMVLAKLGSDRHRFETPEQFAALAGVAPVTRASGKHHGVGFRWACDHELRDALTCLADNSRKRSAWASDMYRRARNRGCDHPHAVRILARAWARVMWRCWRDGVTYDPARHGQAAKLVAA